MKLFLTVILCLLTMNSCIGDGMTDFQREYVNSQKLSEKELHFLNDLESHGYSDLGIILPDFDDVNDTHHIYTLDLKAPFKLSAENSDRIQSLSDSLSLVLYSEVMSDLARENITKVKLRFKEGEKGNVSSILCKEYSKELLDAR